MSELHLREPMSIAGKGYVVPIGAIIRASGITDRPSKVKRANIPKPRNVAALIASAEQAFGVSGIITKSRKQPLVQARAACALILCEEDCSYPAIASSLGWSDHTTALHNVATAIRWCAEDPGYAAAVSFMRAKRPC